MTVKINLESLVDIQIKESGIIQESNQCIPIQGSILTSMSIKQCDTVNCTTINCNTVNCTTIDCTTIDCTTIDCTTERCNKCSGECEECRD